MYQIVLLAGTLLATLTPSFVLSESGLPSRNPSHIRLIAETALIEKDKKTLRAGLQIQLDKDWKTYWRDPGDAGLPIQFTWREQKNVANLNVLWPAPTRFVEFGLQSIGYEKEVVLPIDVTLAEAGQDVILRGTVDYLVCKDICLPVQEDVSLHISVATEEDMARNAGVVPSSANAATLARYRSQVPLTEKASPIKLRSVGGSYQEPWRLRVVAHSEHPFVAPDLFLEGEKSQDLWFSKPKVTMREGNRLAVFSVDVGGQALVDNPNLRAHQLRLTVVDSYQSLDVYRKADGYYAVSVDVDDVIGTSNPWTSYGWILLFALLGGLILNFMPCVLPVLSIKLLGVATAGEDKTLVREGFLFSVAGILFCFLLFALGVLLLRQLGVSVGWGLHFQQPLFIAAMALLMTLFAGNLLGFFELRLPGALSRLWQGDGKRHNLFYENFSSGILATLLATPCSAPFLGTAVGFALSGDSFDIVLVFMVLGLGFSLPWLVVAAFPGSGGFILPKPGPWMQTFRKALSLPLLATVIWLLSLLIDTLSIESLVIFSTSLVVLFVLLFARSKGVATRLPTGVLTTGVLIVMALVQWDFFKDPTAVAQPTSTRQAGIDWHPFAPEKIRHHVQNGKVVFVDITADWCITCQVNKLFVLDKEPIVRLFVKEAIEAQQGDLTRPDNDIATWMAAFGRYGVPFNVIFGPKRPEGIVLPELLSIEGVQESLKLAGEGQAQ